MRREARRSRRAGWAGDDAEEEPPDPKRPLTPEEKALREARAEANRKIGFLAHAVPYAAVMLFLLVVAGFRTAMIVALAWGIGRATR